MKSIQERLSRAAGLVVVVSLCLWVGACPGPKRKRAKPKRMPRVPVEFQDGRYRLRFPVGSRVPGSAVVAQNEYANSRGGSDKLMVWVNADFPAVGNRVFIKVRYSQSADFRIDRQGVDLRDSEGFRFSISERRWRYNVNGTRDLVFYLDTEEALSRIRYNEPSYYLSLSLAFEHEGRALTLDVPRIEPVVERPPPRR